MQRLAKKGEYFLGIQYPPTKYCTNTLQHDDLIKPIILNCTDRSNSKFTYMQYVFFGLPAIKRIQKFFLWTGVLYAQIVLAIFFYHTNKVKLTAWTISIQEDNTHLRNFSREDFLVEGIGADTDEWTHSFLSNVLGNGDAGCSSHDWLRRLISRESAGRTGIDPRALGLHQSCQPKTIFTR